MRKLFTARARKNKRAARMLVNARKDHSIPLLCTISPILECKSHFVIRGQELEDATTTVE